MSRNHNNLASDHNKRKAPRKIAAVAAVSMALTGCLQENGGVPDCNPGQKGTVTVQAGDTLWSLSESVTPKGSDIRKTVHEISEANGNPTTLQPGQILLICNEVEINSVNPNK